MIIFALFLVPLIQCANIVLHTNLASTTPVSGRQLPTMLFNYFRAQNIRRLLRHRKMIKEALVPAKLPPIDTSIMPSMDIANIDITHSIIDETEGLSRTDLLRYLAAQIGASRLHYAQSRYGEEAGKYLHDYMVSISPHFTALLVDVGLMLRLKEFIEFLNRRIENHTGPLSINSEDDVWRLRKAFSDSLGTRRLYCGMLLNPTEAATITANGMWSPISKHSNLADAMKISVQEIAHKHFLGEQRFTEDFVLSTSDNIEVAVLAAMLATTRLPESDSARRKIYIFELQIPRLDTAAFWLRDGMSSYDGNFRYGRAVERYVFWNIRPQEIQSVQIFHLDHGCAKFPLIEPSALDKRDLWRELTAQIYSNMAHKERRQDLRIPGYPHDLTDSIADQTNRIVTPGE